jgi:hypothetical protein
VAVEHHANTATRIGLYIEKGNNAFATKVGNQLIHNLEEKW